jgi:hypothetical protein
MSKTGRSFHTTGGLLFRSALSLLFAAALLPASPAIGSSEVVIAGAGPSTKVVEHFVVYLAKSEAAQGMTFSAP